MAVVAFLVLIFAVTGRSSATWCICKKGLSDSVLQKSLDYACGAGADCNPIHQNGVCYLPNTVQDHCSYAVNSYFQRKGQAQGSCDFAGTAIISTSDPSHSGCAYPSSARHQYNSSNNNTIYYYTQFFQYYHQSIHSHTFHWSARRRDWHEPFWHEY
ncbi:PLASMODESMATA CALLOSE-BINDING PROTEIN 3-like isoform X2 [Juglans microcarpa x Juglans regia]|uniref:PLASMODESMATA CALLOSE-BINDING PROTEIN 3-like isoform X2 n=1 Tax=Juglans microcarpa x Juglans regia TaxID=2249226 RepID=UPI001B7F13CB|nr:PLASMODESMATA CALLOSE-BINDING PROTEIN 3-like isoform X2 [Juglans microcarpa x Juglans regia]